MIDSMICDFTSSNGAKQLNFENIYDFKIELGNEKRNSILLNRMQYCIENLLKDVSMSLYRFTGKIG